MTRVRLSRIVVAAVLVAALIGGVMVVGRGATRSGRTTVVAYFDDSNGIFAGDDVVVLGVPVGKIDKIEPEPTRAKITLDVDDGVAVPADAQAVILSPTLVTARVIQLTPAYTGGPTMRSGAVIPQKRTVVPIEFDDLRQQLQKLTDALQPTTPGGQSTLGQFVTTAADNLRGQGANIRDTLTKLSQVFSTLGDHSDDLFSTVKNVSLLVSALQSSTDLMHQLNHNLASVSGLLANDDNEVGNAVHDLNTATTDLRGFVADNRESLGTTADKLTSVSQALVGSLDDIKQTLHVAPTAFSNFINIYEPANASLTGVLAANNFADPVSFICGAIQAASRLNAAQSSKLCVQYLAPIMKNRQYNFLPLGLNPFVGPQARPNEVTFSEDWLRPLTEAGRVRDYYEGRPPPESQPAPAPSVPTGGPPLPLPAEAATDGSAPSGAPPPAVLPTEAAPTDPNAGLTGMMVPPGGGS